MIPTIFKAKFLPAQLFALCFILLQSCSNNDNKSGTETTADNTVADTAILHHMLNLKMVL
jgi:hypothetical protein